MAELGDIVFDCRHPASLARFWAAAIDGYRIAPYDDDEIARLATLGITDTEDDPTVLLLSDSGGPRLWLQRVPEPKVAKNRLHLDLRTDDRSGEARRLVSLGASTLGHDDERGITTMADPEGNEFCLIEDMSVATD